MTTETRRRSPRSTLHVLTGYALRPIATTGLVARAFAAEEEEPALRELDQ
jgi:hypothetical protein